MNTRPLRHLIGWAALLAATLPALPREARACGGFFTETNSSEVAVMSDIRVLLVQSPGSVEQYVQVGYDGRATRFAWIYPVTGNPQVSEAAQPPFAELETVSRPRVTITTPHDGGGGGGLGCGSADATAGLREDGQNADPSVQVWQQGQVGAFDYVVITATTPDDLLGWLNTNGFAIPPQTQGVIGHYIALKWYFVAMKVSVSAGATPNVPSTTVIRLAYDATEVRYPLKMVSLSPAAATSVEIYLVQTAPGQQLVPAAPFAAVTINPAEVTATSETTHTYEQAFDKAESQGGRRALVLEYASTGWSPSLAHLTGVPTGSALTRLRATFAPDDMDQDLIFSSRPHVEVSSQYQLTYVPAQAAAAPLALLILLLAWRGLRRRRSRAEGQ